MLVATTNQLGKTPEVLGYNSGHFLPGSNTRDWWRYSRVNGARFFVPSQLTPRNRLKASAITDQTSFLAQRTALRSNPVASSLVSWQNFTNRFENNSFDGIVFGYALRELRGLNLQICAHISATSASFPITNTNDWFGRWKFWLHCYAQSFYLAQQFDVQRFQYFNEPNHPNADGLSSADYLLRLQIASDAFQCAIDDVNRLHHKSLRCFVLAPVSAGSPDGNYPKWGRPLILKRHEKFLGQTDTNFFLLHKYDYHQYNSAPWQFGTTASNLNRLITDDMYPEPPLPLTLSEFNVQTASSFLKTKQTLDSPTIFPLLAAKTVNLFNNSVNELYLFKFSQTDYSLGIKKNGTHYVDNTNSPYNIGTITRAGEVWRLINKGFAANRIRLRLQISHGPGDFATMACYDPATRSYYILTANCTNRTNELKINLAAWNIPTGNHMLVEEVSEVCFGSVRSRHPISSGESISQNQPPYSVWLITIPSTPESSTQTISCSDFFTLRDGKYCNTPFVAGSPLVVQNNSTNMDYRNVTFLRFELPVNFRTNIESAFLELSPQTLNNAPLACALVYALDKKAFFSDFSKPGATHVYTWSQSLNLAQGVLPGLDYTNNFLIGVGRTAHLVGQLVATREPCRRLIDITDSLRHSTNANLTFLLVRQNGFSGDNANASALTISTGEKDMPTLKIVR